MHLLERVVQVFAPHTCLGCGAEENLLLCHACREAIAPMPSCCYHCMAVTDGYEVCASCSPHTPLRRVLVHAHYQGLAKELVHQTKYERAQAGVHEMADLLLKYDDFDEISEGTIFVHAPTATSRVRMRGYDQAALLAAELARRAQRPHMKLLTRVGQTQQMGANRTERINQLQEAFRPLRQESIRGKHIMLVDDVLTTGATLEAAARVLIRAGAARVDAVVFAQA